ncbi:hypothetical protein FBU30_004973 [Linnemannia zychae]|nr:hypothetical protein FBU30_004973 [Linnemannia zychae]
MSAPRKLGILVAIPIKGRKLLNRSKGKQSPYIQLTLGSQKKRTKASLIASLEPEWDQEVRLDVFQGTLDMGVSVFDEGKKNELIGEGTLLLHEVIDKGELDVWFPIKHKGVPAGDIYFELTFYAVTPPPPSASVGMPPIVHPHHHPPMQRPGFVPPGPIPHAPPVANNFARPYTPFPAGSSIPSATGYSPHQRPPPISINSSNAPRPYPIPQSNPLPNSQLLPSNSITPYGRPSIGPGFNPMSASGAPVFRPTTQYVGSTPQGKPGISPNNNGPYTPQMNQPVRGPTPISQYPPSNNVQPGQGMMPNSMPIPHPYHHPSPAYVQRPIENRPRPPPGSGPQVTPLMQYNYSLGGSFP